jgi:site-specific recombinase XerD
MEKYKNHPKCLNEDRVLPVWSNQKLNEYLKEIADVCGIKKRFTYHMASHTFATTVTLNDGYQLIW